MNDQRLSDLEPTPAAGARSARRHALALTPFQLRLIRMAVVGTAIAVLALLFGSALWLLGATFAVFAPILLPVALAGVIALVLYPLVDRLHTRLAINRMLAIVLVLAVFFGALVGGTAVLAPLLVEQVFGLMEEVTSWLLQLLDSMDAAIPPETKALLERVGGEPAENGNENGGFGFALDPTAMFFRLQDYLTLLVGLLFVPLFAFFFLIAGPALSREVAELTSVLSTRLQHELNQLIGVFVGYVAAFFQGQLMIALIMGVLYSAGFMLIGLDAGLALGMVCGLLNIVPFLGFVIAIALVLPYAYLQPGDGMTLMLMAAGVIALVQLVESWYLTPRIMSDRSGLHPAVVVFSLFFWGIALGGIIGVILAVPLSAFIATLWNKFRYRYASHLIVDPPDEETAVEIITDTRPNRSG